MEIKFERAPDGDPHQCKGSSQTHGQCPFMAMKHPVTGDYVDYCPRHCGQMQIKKIDKADEALYKANKWEQRILRMEKHPQARSLSAELGVLRLLLEQKLQLYQSDTELMMASGSISDLVVKIEKLVRSIGFLEKQSGLLLDRQQVEALANNFVKIICNYIDNGDILERIIFDIEQELKNVGNPTSNSIPTGPTPESKEEFREDSNKVG